MPDRIWVDVKDLFQDPILNVRPSGIQRIEFELCRSLAFMPESRDRVRFVRHAATEDSFYAIPFAEVDALHARLTTAASAVPRFSSTHRARQPAGGAHRSPSETVPAAWVQPHGLGVAARRLAYQILVDVRTPLITIFKAQRDRLQATGRLTSAAWIPMHRNALAPETGRRQADGGWFRDRRGERRRPARARIALVSFVLCRPDRAHPREAGCAWRSCSMTSFCCCSLIGATRTWWCGSRCRHAAYCPGGHPADDQLGRHPRHREHNRLPTPTASGAAELDPDRHRIQSPCGRPR